MGTGIKHLLFFFRKNLEAFIWLTALILLFFLEPTSQHHSLCVFHNLGMDFCPGCGLGRSIAWFFNGEIMLSLKSHPFGIIAVFILTFRIFQVFRNSSRLNKSTI